MKSIDVLVMQSKRVSRAWPLIAAFTGGMAVMALGSSALSNRSELVAPDESILKINRDCQVNTLRESYQLWGGEVAGSSLAAVNTGYPSDALRRVLFLAESDGNVKQVASILQKIEMPDAMKEDYIARTLSRKALIAENHARYPQYPEFGHDQELRRELSPLHPRRAKEMPQVHCAQSQAASFRRQLDHKRAISTGLGL